MRNKLSVVAVLALLVGSSMLVGCNRNRVTVGELRRDPSPEFWHLNRSWGQVRNDHARAWDTYFRAALDDIDRLVFMDEATELHPYPQP